MESRSPTLAQIRDSLSATRLSTVSITDRRSVWRRRLLTLESVMGVVISANCIALGISADIAPDWFGWVVIDGVFALIFLAETVFKMRLEGWRAYVWGDDRVTKTFDLLLVTLAVLELGFALARRGSGIGMASDLFKVVRGFRVCRMVRILRFDMFSELKMMVRRTLGGMRTLMWSVVLIMLPVYMMS